MLEVVLLCIMHVTPLLLKNSTSTVNEPTTEDDRWNMSCKLKVVHFLEIVVCFYPDHLDLPLKIKYLIHLQLRDVDT